MTRLHLIIIALFILNLSSLQCLQRKFKSKDVHYWKYVIDPEESTEVCTTGIRQSPVDLDDVKSVKAQLPPFVWSGHWDEREEGFELENMLHTVEVHYPDQNSRITGGPLNDVYILSQTHFHWGESNNGTEHAINHKRYSLEAHLVHYKQEYGTHENATMHVDGLAVVALVFEVSSMNNSDMNGLIAGLREVHEGSSKTIIPPNSMAWLEYFADSQHFYTYEGSLTTPPCSEVVTWIVMKHPGYIGELQLEEFHHLLGEDGTEIMENVRPLQPINGRHILYCSNGFKSSYSSFWLILFTSIVSSIIFCT